MKDLFDWYLPTLNIAKIGNISFMTRDQYFFWQKSPYFANVFEWFKRMIKSIINVRKKTWGDHSASTSWGLTMYTNYILSVNLQPWLHLLANMEHFIQRRARISRKWIFHDTIVKDIWWVCVFWNVKDEVLVWMMFVQIGT